ncbi:Outer membrane protein ImpK/VasF, OmpA/MotB domain [hydrothermal vent metagenome]|uniref:Outer membrane protein ImpK/VasF, OmpA/MotB domain n=1 Tax=hydrothermal vent metagenome TaxID=652676 RepID=A0A3B0W458_9ZZZZ
MNNLPYNPEQEIDSKSASSLQKPDVKDLVFHDERAAVSDKEMITFEGVEQIDHDIDFGFRLRGHNLNPLLDAATPLLGLVMRARRLTDHEHVPQLYVRVRDEITVVLEEIKQEGYDGPTQLAYSYCLCAFVDEAIMATPWGAYSVWAERSMLSIYHDETWGGEKFFTILSRMLLEPEKYQDMLELGYYCLSLGFRGKYGMEFDGAAQLQAIMRKLHSALRNLRGDPVEALQDGLKQVRPTRYEFKKDTPLWAYWGISGGIILIAYVTYLSKLSEKSTQVLKQLASLI